jgi:predicted ester cyclase
MYRAASPDLRITVNDVIAADDNVVLPWHSEGTHRGELAGLAPTGAHGSVTGISIDRSPPVRSRGRRRPLSVAW